MEAEGVAESSSSMNRRSKMPEKQLGSFLVGSIVEKGFSSSENSGTVVSFPRTTVLPFPVARHRSHDPHWSPAAPTMGVDADDQCEDKDIVDYGFAAPLAQPMKKKEKKGLDLSRWKELADGKLSTSSYTVNQKQESAIMSKAVDKKIGDNVVASSEAAEFRLKREETNGIIQPAADMPAASVESRKLLAGFTMDSSESHMEKTQFQSGIQPAAMNGDQEESLDYISHHRGKSSMTEDIDRENLIRLSQMSPLEIADAQAEIMEKMNPRILEMLRKRGQDRRGTRRVTPSEEKEKPNLINDNLVKRAKGSKFEGSEIKLKSGTTPSSQKMESSAVSNEGLPFGVRDSGLWKSWCERVEKARDLRFTLDANVINVGPHMELDNDVNTSFRQYKPENVAERDFLRTEGDPGAAGYTLKEAIALSRSIIPSQRCFALQLIGSVLNKCMHHLQGKDGDVTINAKHFDRAVDWQAIWAYALGPELEIGLSLRISLDDNHNSVILASTKVLQTILSFDANELYFDLSEKLCFYETDVYTAPVFRSRPDINLGYLPCGFWKYSSKPSNILPFNDEKEGVDDEEGRTIQDDVVVAGQDIAGGLVRMGILPRICYLLEVDPLPNLDECLLSVLTSLARHSLSCASAIMKCPSLIETVINRLTKHRSVDIYPSTIKSVALLRVLLQADRQYCSEFLKRGFFQDIMRDMYRGPISFDEWIKSGKERCNLTSLLMIEQLRLWRVCIRYGYCVSYFEDFFPAMSTWLNLPTLEKLAKENVLEEFALVAREAYHVLESLSLRLPGLHSEAQLKREALDTSDDMESWSWSRVIPMVDLASKWLSLRNSSVMPFILINERDSYASCIIWVVSAVMHMLASIFDKVNAEDTAALPWLPFFVPMVGLEVVKNGFFDFTHLKDRQEEKGAGKKLSFISVLSKMRIHNNLEPSLSSLSCLHGLVCLVNSIDKCIQSAKGLSRSSKTFQEDYSSAENNQVLEDGIAKWAQTDIAKVFLLLTGLLSSEWRSSQKIEVFGRGGPAPGVGCGWGSSGGGYWSTRHLLKQADAHLIISLLRIYPTKDLTFTGITDGTPFFLQRINAMLGICLVSGPRDRLLLEKALDYLLQPQILEFMGSCINDFTHSKTDLKLFGQRYCNEDYQFLYNVLSSHFKSFWLGYKSKSKTSSKIDGGSTKRDALEMIPEDMEISDACSLQVKWAYQRLPFPVHWFLSPLSCISLSQDTVKPSPSDDSLDVAKSGLFFLLGLEAISYPKSSSNYESPVLAVPLVWKLHALSAVLLVRTETMDVLGDDNSRDYYEYLQKFYGRELDRLRHNVEGSLEILKFQSQVYESYDTFIENLIEQFGAVSYGNVLYGRQIALYLHRSVEAVVRLAAWNSLANSHVLELLPPLDKCYGEAEGYLEPIEDNEEILEVYAKTLVCGSLDRASARRSITSILPIHHLSYFIFNSSPDKISFRNKLVKLLLRGYSRRPPLKKVLLNLIQYGQESVSGGRFDILSQACEGNSSLLSQIAKLKLFPD